MNTLKKLNKQTNDSTDNLIGLIKKIKNYA